MTQNTGTLVAATIRPVDSGDTIATAVAAEVQGAYFAVADITARDAITVERRTIGQRVHVISTGQDWRLVGGISNANWVVIVNAANGQAAIDGTISNTTPVVVDLTGLTLNRSIYLQPGPGCVMKLEYSTDAGATWNVVFAAATAYVSAYLYVSAGDTPNRLRITATTAAGASTYHIDGDSNALQPGLQGIFTDGTPQIVDLSSLSMPRTGRLLPKGGDTVKLEVSYDGGASYNGAEQLLVTGDQAFYVYADTTGTRPTTLRLTRSAGTGVLSQWALSGGQL